MGNCSVKSVSDAAEQMEFIRIMTDSGDILQLKGPKLVGEVLENFPGYKIFMQNHVASALLDDQQLVDGQVYHLLPDEKTKPAYQRFAGFDGVMKPGNSSRNGVWSVKLVINSEKLEDILSEKVNTEAFIEQMRIAASSATPGRTKRWRNTCVGRSQCKCEI